MTTSAQETSRLSALAPTTVAFTDLEDHGHLVFRCMRPLTPVIKRDDGIYIAIRAADVERLATDPRTRQLETEIASSRDVNDDPLFDFFKNTMLPSNAPEHRRKRAPIARAFAYKLIEELRPHIRAVANELIDAAYVRGEMNFSDDYASQIPTRVVSELLGLPQEEIPEFTRHVNVLARALSSSFSRHDVPELQVAAQKLTRYTDKLLQARHVEPRKDLLSSYIMELDTSGALSPVETLVQVVSVILAGSDTTRLAMAIQTSLLLQHREQWDAVCQDASLIPGAVLESLRYEPAVGSFARFTLEDIELDGWTVPRNCVLSLSTMSAMRDPALYEKPEKFDIRRAEHPSRHRVFGGGAHRCLGEALASAELEESLAVLAARLPQLRLVGDRTIVHGCDGIRSVEEMQVRWS